MSHFKSSVSSLCGITLALSVAACGESAQTRVNTPSSAQRSPSVQNEMGEANNQPNEAHPLTPQSETGAAQATAPNTTEAAQDQRDQTWPGAAPSTTSASGASGSTAGVTNPMGGMDVSNLTDAQVAAVVQAINQGEIAAAQLAETKASSSEVKRFAQHMAASHRDMMNKDRALLARLQIIPSDNAASNQLKSDSQSELSALKGMRGKDFDRDYIDAQVRDHNNALELLDRVTPNVRSAEYKAQIQSAQPMVEAHLREAERLQQVMQKGSTNLQPNGPDMPPAAGTNMGPSTR